MRLRRLEVAAGLLSLAAGSIHGVATGAHFEQWWGYGLFFAVAALAQALYGLVLLALPRDPSWPPGSWRRFRVRLFAVGVAGNLAILALWFLTRTVGVPTGPDSGALESVGALDLASKLAEALLVSLVAGLWWEARRPALAPKR